MRCKSLKILILIAVIAFLPLSARAADEGAAPIAHWRFDEGGGPTGYDDAGSLDGTLTPGDNTGSNDTAGEMWSLQGKINGALELDGTNDYVLFPTLPPSITGALTISAWFKTNSTGTQDIYSEWQGGANIIIGISSGKIRTYLNTNGTSPGWTNNRGSTLNTGQWYFLTVVYTGSYFDLYLDGEGADVGTVVGTGNVNRSAGLPARIGVSETNVAVYNNWFNGLIDDARIYNYARSAAQIKQDYNNGMAVRLAAGTDPNEGNPPIAYWKFDKNTGTTAYDRSGSGYDGTLGGDGAGSDVPTWAQGKHGPALSFDGTDDYVDMGNSVNLGTGAFTIELWVKQGSSGALSFVEKRQDNQEQWIFSLSGGKPYFIYDAGPSGTSDYAYTVSSTVLQQGKWYHLVAVVDRQSPYYPIIYVNGVYDGVPSTSVSGNPGTADMDNTGSLYIGRSTYNSVDNYFNGLIDEVKVYNYARTPAQVAYDYNKGKPIAHYKFDEGTGVIVHNDYSTADSGAAPVAYLRMDNNWTDSSGNGNNATTGGDPAFSSSSKIGPYCGNFDGTGDYARIADAQSIFGGKSVVTVEFWIKPAAGTQSSIHYIEYGSGTSTFSLETGVPTANFYINNISQGAISVTADAWQHIALVMDGTNSHRYKNGALVDSTAFNSTINDVSSGFDVGGRGGSRNINALFDDVRIYDYARTPEQIYSDYKSSHGTLVGDTKFVDGKIGKALEFDGTGDYVVIPNMIQQPNLEQEWSVSAWVKIQAKASQSLINLNNDLALNHSTTNKLLLYLNSGANDYYDYGNFDLQDNEWHHVEFVFRNSDGLKEIYVDGVDVSTTGPNATSIPSGIPSALKIGNGAKGLIDDVRIYNYARTQAQITEDYTAGAARLGAQSAGVADPWGGALPVGHWKLDENTGVLARDASGNGNDGTLKNMTSADWQAGKQGSALYFDGADDDDYVVADALGSVNDYTTEITLAAWAKSDASVPNQDGFLWKAYEGFVGSGDWNLSTSADGKWRGLNVTSNVTVDTNWHHIVSTVDASGSKIYIDGVLSNSNATTTLPNNDTNSKVIIGTWYRSTLAGDDWDGKVDDVRIYSYALTQAQVAWLYNKGKPVGHWRMNEATSGSATGTDTIKDDSGKGNNGDGSGTNLAWTTGKFGGGLIFNGTDDYVNCGTDSSLNMTTNDFTVSAWVKQASADKASNASIVGKYGTPGWNLMLDNGGPRIYMYQEAGKLRSVGSSDIADNTWHYVAAVTDFDGYTRLYVDGVEVGTADNTSYDTMTTGQAVRIGTRNGGPYFKGTIDDVRIYNYKRTTAQIKEDYNNGLAVRLGD